MRQWKGGDDDGGDDCKNNQQFRENLVHKTTKLLRSICSKRLNLCSFRQDKIL